MSSCSLLIFQANSPSHKQTTHTHSAINNTNHQEQQRPTASHQRLNSNSNSPSKPANPSLLYSSCLYMWSVHFSASVRPICCQLATSQARLLFSLVFFQHPTTIQLLVPSPRQPNSPKYHHNHIQQPTNQPPHHLPSPSSATASARRTTSRRGNCYYCSALLLPLLLQQERKQLQANQAEPERNIVESP